jgi:hypothetical protein
MDSTVKYKQNASYKYWSYFASVQTYSMLNFYKQAYSNANCNNTFVNL